MLAHTVRSGLIESMHRGSAIAVDASGKVLFEHGDPDRPIFYRSAIKPLQAMVAHEVGLDLSQEEVAVTCASHDGLPAHVALVDAVLANGGLGRVHLQTPPAWPISDEATFALRRAGHDSPEPIWHNCSGKHAGWLAACGAAGWDPATYLDSDHPLQRRVRAIVAAATGMEPEPFGVDGCGAPTPQGSARGLATAFARISSDPTFEPVAQAVHRFPSLVASNDRADGKLGAWWDGPLKPGAEGLLGAGRHGVGIAVRSEEGSIEVAVIAAIKVAEMLGMLSPAALDALRPVATPDVFGGGRPVGAVVPAIAL